MFIQSEWYDKDAAIILMKFTKSWSAHERKMAERQAVELAKEASTRFDMIVDYSQAAPFIPVGTLRDWVTDARWRDKTFPNWGLTVFVSTSPTLKAYYDEGCAFSDIIQSHCRMVDIFDAALQLIKDDRQSKQSHDKDDMANV